MATTSFIDLAPGEELLYYSGLQVGDRFTFSKINRKLVFLSRKRKNGLTARSLLPAIAASWALLSSAVRASWSVAGAECGLNGYRLFVKDTTIRLKNELVGLATPSLLHQAWVGNLKIVEPATLLKIEQLHPRSYYVSRKVTGKKGMYEPVLVTEDFALPLKISLNYYADLLPQDISADARFYAKVWSSYQGVDLSTELLISLCFSTRALFGVASFGANEYGVDEDSEGGWLYAEATLTSVQGYVVGYDLHFDLENLQGDLYIDNVKAEHSSQNWVRDTYCNDINQGFTRAFFQVPKHWVADEAPAGSSFESTYKDF